MKTKRMMAMAVMTAMAASMAVSISVTAAENDLFDPANYKSEKESSEWTIAVITKDNTSAWFKLMEEGVKEFGE